MPSWTDPKSGGLTKVGRKKIELRIELAIGGIFKRKGSSNRRKCF
jgi:hypothetical protein